MTREQAELYARNLPLGDLQRRVLRGEEDERLAKIVDALEAVLEDRIKRLGYLGRMGPTNPHLSLIETIEICWNRLRMSEGISR